MELKLGEAGDSELAQVERYLRNAELQATVANVRLHGLLIADRFQSQVVARASERDDLTLVRYSQTQDGALALAVVVGDDVLAPYCLGAEARDRASGHCTTRAYTRRSLRSRG